MIDKFVTNKIAELTIEGEKYSLPIIEGTEGEKAIDIRKLRQETGYITLDSGYMNTGSCTSEITYLEGSKGILNYRGYAIEDLAENCSFIEVAYLLLHGHLPTAKEYQKFAKENKIIGCICSGAQLLISAKIVKNKKISGYYSMIDDINNAGGIYTDLPAVIDSGIITTAHYKDMGPWMKAVIDEFYKANKNN